MAREGASAMSERWMVAGHTSSKEFIEELNEENLVVVVEGKKDALALRKAGYIGKIYIIGTKPTYQVVDELKGNKEVIILTDLDKRGRKKAHDLCSSLQREGVKCVLKYRKKLHELGLQQVEGFLSLLKKRR